MKKIKFLIGFLSLIAVTCLFGLFNNSDTNKVYASGFPSIKTEFSDSVTPGSTFDIDVTFDATNVGADETWWSIVHKIYVYDPDNLLTIPDSTQWIWPQEFALYDFDVCKLRIKEASKIIDLSITCPSDSDDLITTSLINKFTVKVPNVQVSNDAATTDIKVTEDPDWESQLEIGDYIYLHIDDELTVNESDLTISIKGKSTNSIFDTVNITGGDGESWTFCDTDDNVDNNTEDKLVGQTLNVAATTSSIALSATAQELGTILSVTPGTGSNGSYNIPLNSAGENTDVTVKILAEKASDYAVGSAEYNALIKEYTFTVARAKYDVATLDGLEFSLSTGQKGNISMSPSFTSDNDSYTLTLPEDLSTIVVKPTITPNVNIQAVKFGTQTLTSGQANTIDITGLTDLVFTVVAQDGTEGTYTVTLDPKSNDNDLQADPVATLITTDGDQALSLTKDGDSYTAEVDYTKTVGFNIDATQNSSLASIAFNPASKEINFSSGYAEESKTITITVTSESGIAREYTVTVKRLKADENVDINYVVKGANTQTEYSPTIVGNKWMYELPVSEENAVISYDGLADTTTVSGTASAATLAFSTTYYTLTITPENPNAAKSYEIYITKAKDTDNTITDIKILTEAGGSAVEGINYSFTQSSTDVRFTYTVPYTVSSIYFEVVYPQTGSISVIGTQNLTKTGDSNPNIFVVYATSESDVDGVKYTFNIIRTPADTDNTLSSLKISGTEYILNGELTTNKICLDRNTASILVEAVKNSEFATIDEDDSTLGTITLSAGGVFKVKVIVLSQENKSKTYEIEVHTKEQLNTITGISLVGSLMDGTPYTINYTFQSGVQPSSIEVPYKVSSVEFTVTTNATDGLYTCSVNDAISLPINQNKPIKVAITSEYGVEGDAYTFNIKRGPADTENQLDSLSLVIDGKEYIKGVEGVVFDVTGVTPTVVVIPNTVDLTSVTKGIVTATLPSGSLATIISGTGEIPLSPTGFNHQVVVSAEDTTKKRTYTISIQIEGQELSDNNTITSIQLKGGANKDFLEGVTLEQIKACGEAGYQLIIPYNVTLLTAVVSTESSFATVVGATDPYEFDDEGDSHLICIYAIAQNTDPGQKYYINVTRDTSKTDAYLTELVVGDKTYTNDIPDNIVVRVDHSVTKIDLSAIACDSASINPNLLGEKLLSSIGPNPFVITVVAQNPDYTKDYNITVYRAEDDATLTDITVSNTNYEFNAEQKTIELTVDYTVTSITFNVSSTATYADGVGAFTYQLDSTTTTTPLEVVIQVKSEYSKYNSIDGKVSDAYTFKIKRTPRDTNTYLSNLEVQIGGETVEFDSAFVKTDDTYIIENVAKDVTSVFIIATPEASTSVVNPTGNFTLASGSIVDSNTYIITLKVTAQAVAGDQEVYREYKIYVSRSEVDLSNKKEVTSITIKGNDNNIYFQSQFNPSETTYAFNVPYEVSSVYVNATYIGASIKGLDVYNIAEGASVVITVYAVSENGDEGTKYNITITRASANDDSTLAFIKIDGTIIDGFSSGKFNYSKFVLYSTSTIDLTAQPSQATSIMRITINNKVHTGLQIALEPDTQTVIQIMVIAQNGDITPYTVTVTRASADGVLSDLYIEETNFHDENGQATTFNPDTKTYYATVSYAYEYVTICGAAADFTVEVRGVGKVSLVVGKQEFQVAAIPRTGNVTIYTIVIIRKAEATNTTKVGEFSITEIPSFKTDFNDSLNIYDGYSVASGIKKLTFNIVFDVAEFEDSPTYEVINNNLNFGINAVILLVTSPDLSTTRTIIIQVERCDVEVASANIKQISKFNSEFTNEGLNYTYKVKSNVKELDISLDLVDSENNTYEISDTKLKEGNNTITITLKTGDEVNKVIYLNVYREASSNIVDYAVAAGSAAILISCFFIFRKKKRKI